MTLKEKKIYTMKKYEETFYDRHIAFNISCSEVV